MEIEKTLRIQDIFEKYKVTVTDSGYAKVDAEWNDKNVCSPFSRIYYVSKGSAVISFKSGEMRLTENNFYLIPLGVRFSRKCENEFEHLYFHINISSPSGYDLLKNTVCVGRGISSAELDKIKRLYFSGKFTEQIELACELYRSVKDLLEIQPNMIKSEITISPDIQKTIDYIKIHLSMQLTAEEIAKNLYMSKNTLSKKFCAEMGIPLGKYIDKLVFYEAEKLLTETQLPISDISTRLGFCDRFYFSRRFKQLFEETPLEYRKRTRKSAT